MSLRQNLQQTYSQSNWKTWFPELFGTNISIENKAEKIIVNNSNAKSIERFASLKLSESKNIAVLDITTDKNIQISKNKVGLRNIVSKFIDQDKYHGILAFYHSEDERQKDYRLSFISSQSSFDEEGNFKTKSTHPKRYTFILGATQSCNTAAKRFSELQKKKSIALEDVTNAFSVSSLTKEFYNELFKWYEWTLSEEVGVSFPRDTNTELDNRERLEEQIIRLITRLLFVWFIKQKHLVPNNLFDKEELKNILKDFNPNDSKSGNYYNAILQNLFFATLNKTVTERAFAKEENTRDIKTLYRYAEMFRIKEKEVLELFSKIPFLNGGLFECLDKETSTDGVKYHLDGFSRNDKKVKGQFSHRAFIPNCVFFDEEKGIIPLLQRYNFTVEENAPEDVQVALDPELLGNVFENLLGAFNIETKESARKQSGSFYTPREIVDFMVSESLQAYLKEKIGDVDLNGKLSDAEKKKIYNTLLKVKILDPACGSGAFPMGILNGIITLLEKIGVAESLDMYKLKLHLIENCIYGVDLQTIAAQISKLRFFISLIVEQGEMNFKKENYGVITLPNLETKFVAANTLLGLHKKQAQGNLFEDPAIETTKQEILNVRHEHFYAQTAKEKRQLREKDEKLRNRLVKLLEANHEFAPEDAKQVALWNPYDQNSSSPFFDSEWMFGVKDGFDIVIGNPPYVQLQKESGRLAKMFEKSGYKTFERTGDIYSLFYEKGTELLKPQGHLCFITSNKWMRAGYGESTRKFFAENTNPVLLIDFAGQKIFESATVDTNILLLSKQKNQQKTLACMVKEKVLNNLSVFVRQQGTECKFVGGESWKILSPIEQSIKRKIEAVGTPLKEWDINIYRGILTGYNEAFIIDGATKEKLIKEDPKSAEIIRPILRGRDIKRYGYDFGDLWLINTHNGIKEKAIKPINIKDYPAIKKHLDKYYPELEKRADKGDTPYNLRNCAYMDDFFKQKIMYPNMTKYLPFYLDDKGFVQNDKSFMITGKNIAFLTAFLNSSIFKYCFIDNFPELQGGTRELRKIFLDKIPVLEVSDKTNKEFEKLVLKLQDLIMKQMPTKELEIEIDEKIFDIYSLTKNERKIIGFIEIQ